VVFLPFFIIGGLNVEYRTRNIDPQQDFFLLHSTFFNRYSAVQTDAPNRNKS
jgi:hypothetical protein